MTKISKIITNCMLVTFPVIWLMASSVRAENYLENVNPSAAELCKKVINEGVKYHTDKKTGTRDYFKKMRDGFFCGRVYVTVNDRIPYGPSNNDEYAIDQELSLEYEGRFIKITDKGLDLVVDGCEGECGGGLERDFPETVKDLLK